MRNHIGTVTIWHKIFQTDRTAQAGQKASKNIATMVRGNQRKSAIETGGDRETQVESCHRPPTGRAAENRLQTDAFYSIASQCRLHRRTDQSKRWQVKDVVGR